MRTFTKAELVSCAKSFPTNLETFLKKDVELLTKIELANAFAAIFGNGQKLLPKKSPPKLRRILKDYLSKRFNKETLNAITATKNFLI